MLDHSSALFTESLTRFLQPTVIDSAVKALQSGDRITSSDDYKTILAIYDRLTEIPHQWIRLYVLLYFCTNYSKASVVNADLQNTPFDMENDIVTKATSNIK